MNKKAILVVSFGTSYEDARTSCIDPVEELIRNANSEFEVRRAFTSRRIIKKLKDRDQLEISNEKEALESLKSEGFNEIFVQPLHVMPGYEYEKIKRACALARHGFDGDIKLGEPLIYTEEDYEAVVKALETSVSGLEESVDAWLFMGHGTEHHANATYSCLQMHFEQEKKAMHVAALESFPNLEDTMPRLKDRAVKTIGLMPFMLVAGDHAQNDMAGPDEESWVNVLKEEGFTVKPHVVGLGALEAFQKIFVSKVEKLVEA